MIDVFIGLAIFGLGVIVGAITTSVIKTKIIVMGQEEDKPIVEPIAKKFYKLELAENDNLDEEDRKLRRDQLEDRNFYS